MFSVKSISQYNPFFLKYILYILLYILSHIILNYMLYIILYRKIETMLIMIISGGVISEFFCVFFFIFQVLFIFIIKYLFILKLLVDAYMTNSGIFNIVIQVFFHFRKVFLHYILKYFLFHYFGLLSIFIYVYINIFSLSSINITFPKTFQLLINFYLILVTFKNSSCILLYFT